MVEDDVRAAYLDGLDAVRLAAATVDDWSAPTACTAWHAVDVAGHLVLVVRMYDEHLARAAREPVPSRFACVRERATENERALAGLPASSGPQRVGAFHDTALAYLSRVEASPHLRFRREDHVVTAAEHLVCAAIEFHLHAWDLDRDRAHPDCAPVLVEGWRAHLPSRVPDGHPWPALLLASGRTP